MADRALAVRQVAELFRERGYATTSLPDITAATGLGRGSLYHLFPGGKAQMLTEVLDDVDAWFETSVFGPLRDDPDGIGVMAAAVRDYFRRGERLCLVGRVALEPTDDELATRLAAYFVRWDAALTQALLGAGHLPDAARDLAEDVVAGIQGALVLSRALGDPAVFDRTVDRLVARCATP